MVHINESLQIRCLQCNSGQYQTRTNNIRIFVERTMADPSLYSELRDIAVRRKLMEGPYPGIELFVTEKKCIISFK